VTVLLLASPRHRRRNLACTWFFVFVNGWRGVLVSEALSMTETRRLKKQEDSRRRIRCARSLPRKALGCIDGKLDGALLACSLPRRAVSSTMSCPKSSCFEVNALPNLSTTSHHDHCCYHHHHFNAPLTVSIESTLPFLHFTLLFDNPY